jgi:membrane associated rhomboid family serine protease
MIPFRDNIPSRSFPIINITIILTNVLVFFYELERGRHLQRFITHYGVVPAAVFNWPESSLPVGTIALPFLTSMFLHAGWLHLIGNMWYLWIFGRNVEGRLGHFNYLIFYLVCGFGAGIVHTLFNYNVTVPSIGASGAIAGVLGAYLVSYPFARVLTLVPIFFIFVIEIPAIIVLGFWFVMQFLYGATALASPVANSGGVAWWAHVGGFIVGMILVGLFPRKDRPRYEYTWQS